MWLLTFASLSFLFLSLSGTELLNLTLSCMCVFVNVYLCVFVCAGSHRIIDTEFDDGLMVVSKGGWGGHGYQVFPGSSM